MIRCTQCGVRSVGNCRACRRIDLGIAALAAQSYEPCCICRNYHNPERVRLESGMERVLVGHAHPECGAAWLAEGGVRFVIAKAVE